MSDAASSLSRRQLMGGGALGLAATLAAPAIAQRGPAMRAAAILDPRANYPRPPFASQTQPWPGLASRMTPRPDHGENSYRGSGRLTGRKALITGGDSGMGRAAAIAFAREGADVAINYLPAEEPDAREVVALIRAAGRRAVAIPGDIRTERFCRDLVERARRELGGLDILVNNAARQQSRETILDIESEEFDATMKTNIYAPFWITKAAVPHMPPGSAIIITSSEQAQNPSAHLFHYAQTKAANTNYAMSLAKQLGPRGIRVNAVAPGPIWTPLQVSGGSTQERLVRCANTALGRPGQPAELASIYVQLAAGDASFASGETYRAHGGGKVD
jgi:NAD(P)-dependent dehydrogenase (short-subunit alcohol dehydrogenase family)